MKLYAITKGDYSSYHICALTVDKKKAMKLKKVYSDEWYDAMIEEFEDGQPGELNICWYYNNWFDEAKVEDYAKPEKIEFRHDGVLIGAYVFASDEEHAKKKAHDMIAKYKAEQAGL